MARPKKAEPSHRLEVLIPSSIYAKLRMELYSELEGRIPHGDLSNLVSALVADWLRARGIQV